MNDSCTNQIEQIANLLYEPGNYFEFGCLESDLHRLIEVAISLYPNMGRCAVKEWMIWDLNFSQEIVDSFVLRGLQPVMIYAHFVVSDATQRFALGDSVKSSALVKLDQGCFFVTQNTVYILIGKGTRKTVEPHLVKAVYF